MCSYVLISKIFEWEGLQVASASASLSGRIAGSTNVPGPDGTHVHGTPDAQVDERPSMNGIAAVHRREADEPALRERRLDRTSLTRRL